MTFPRSLAPAALVVLAFLLIYVPIYLPRAQAQANSVSTDLNLTFTTIDVPGAVITSVQGINMTGDMVGYYGEANTGPASGFLLSNGNFTLFDYPGGNSTYAFGINDSGLISGSAFVRQSTAAVSFLYDGTTFTTVRAPGKSSTRAVGINNAGTIAGAYGTLSIGRGFMLRGTQFKTLSPPGNFLYVSATGINNLGGVVGWTIGDSDSGFFYKGGQFQTVSFPGASQTLAWGINDSGIIVGWYEKGPPFADHGFALVKGKYISLDYPGASQTLAFGINASGQIVGSYTFDGQTFHGFVTNPIAAD